MRKLLALVTGLLLASFAFSQSPTGSSGKGGGGAGGGVSSITLTSSGGTMSFTGSPCATSACTFNFDIPTTYLASPPVIGGTTPNQATFTFLQANRAATFADFINTQSSIQLHSRYVTAAGAITVATSDMVVCLVKSTGAATAANLESSPNQGHWVTIKDCKGDAATNNITVTPASGTIDGAATYVISTAYGSWMGFYDGVSAWHTLAVR